MVHSQQERVPKFSCIYHIGGRWRAITKLDASVESLPRSDDASRKFRRRASKIGSSQDCFRNSLDMPVLV